MDDTLMLELTEYLGLDGARLEIQRALRVAKANRLADSSHRPCILLDFSFIDNLLIDHLDAGADWLMLALVCKDMLAHVRLALKGQALQTRMSSMFTSSITKMNWASSNFAKEMSQPRSLDAAVRGGDLAKLKLLVSRHPSYIGSHHLLLAASCEHIDMLNHIYDTQFTLEREVDYDLYLVALSTPKARPKLMAWLEEHDTVGWSGDPYEEPDDEFLLASAAIIGNFEGLLWGNNLGMPWDERVPEGIAVHGDVAMMEIVFDSGDFAASVSACTTAARYGHLELVEWFYKREKNNPGDGVYVDAFECCYEAADRGHTHVLKWLFQMPEFDMETHARSVCERAAAHANLPMLKFARAAGCPWGGRFLGLVAASGNIVLLEWAFNNGAVASLASLNNIGGMTKETLDWVVQWIRTSTDFASRAPY